MLVVSFIANKMRSSMIQRFAAHSTASGIKVNESVHFLPRFSSCYRLEADPIIRREMRGLSSETTEHKLEVGNVSDRQRSEWEYCSHPKQRAARRVVKYHNTCGCLLCPVGLDLIEGIMTRSKSHGGRLETYGIIILGLGGRRCTLDFFHHPKSVH
jgi:hypothetical protein